METFANDPESTPESSPSALTRAQELKSEGVAPAETLHTLINEGYSEEVAARSVVEAWKTEIEHVKQQEKRRGHPDAAKNMVIGGLWCLGGIIVTAATYSAAQGGGTYVVAWGAIAFGGIQFLRGLFQSFS